MVLVDQGVGLGGGQYVMLELAARLAAQCDVRILCPRGDTLDRAAALGLEALELPRGPWARWRILRRIACEADRLVISGLRIAPVCLLAVGTIPSCDRPRTCYVNHSSPFSVLRRTILRAVLAGAGANVNVARCQKRTPKTIEVPPLGLTSEVVSRLGVQAARPWSGRIRAFGRLDPVKGLDILAQALESFDDELRSGVEVAVSDPIEGDRGGYADHCRALLSPFLVAGGRGPAWFEPGDIVVIPSLSETAALTAQEAAVRGTLIVAAAVGDLPCITRADQGGMLFPAGDAAALRSVLRRAISMPQHEFVRLIALAQDEALHRADHWYDSLVEHLSV